MFILLGLVMVLALALLANRCTRKIKLRYIGQLLVVELASPGSCSTPKWAAVVGWLPPASPS